MAPAEAPVTSRAPASSVRMPAIATPVEPIASARPAAEQRAHVAALVLAERDHQAAREHEAARSRNGLHVDEVAAGDHQRAHDRERRRQPERRAPDQPRRGPPRSRAPT